MSVSKQKLSSVNNKSKKPSTQVIDFLGLSSGGSQGPKGDPGKSAYEIWLEQGNKGSIQDFLNSLKGEKGDTGAQGARGLKGDKGESFKDDVITLDNPTLENSDNKARGAKMLKIPLNGNNIAILSAYNLIKGDLTFIDYDNIIKDGNLVIYTDSNTISKIIYIKL